MCLACGRWFQINRKQKANHKQFVLEHLAGVSFRSLADKHDLSPATAYRHYLRGVNELPHCADITREYCDRYCGILLVDGKYIAIKGYARKIPVIYGIDYQTHDIPTYILAVAENTQACRKFFSSLRLLNYPLQGIVTDDNASIYQSASFVYPKTISQICHNHYKQSLRLSLGVGRDPTYIPFMKDIEFLFEKKRSLPEFNSLAGKIYLRYSSDQICISVMTDIQKRMSQLLAYTQLPGLPTTNNLIESYNSHLEGRLKTIKGFESFHHANTWLNAYFIRRRLKKFTDCAGKFTNLNGKSSLEISLRENKGIATLLSLVR